MTFYDVASIIYQAPFAGGVANTAGGGNGILPSMLASGNLNIVAHASAATAAIDGALVTRIAELGFAAHFGLTPAQLRAKAGTRQYCP